MHLGGQIPPDEDLPSEDGAETENSVFDDGEHGSIGSPSKAHQLLPLALTTGSKSPVGALDSGSTSKQATAADATSVKTEESEGSTPSVSPPLTRNPPSAGTEDPLHVRGNTLIDGAPLNGSKYSEEETHADLGKAPIATFNSAVVNGDSEADDTPLSLCVSKPTAENDMPHGVINNDVTSSEENNDCSTEEQITSPDSNPKPTGTNPLPALTPPASPKARVEAEEACGSVPQEPQERDATQSKGMGEASTPREPLPALDPEKVTPVEEGYSVPEEPLEDPEPSVPAPATHSQPPRPDKPYSCSQCGKAYASRSGLKVRVEDIKD